MKLSLEQRRDKVHAALRARMGQGLYDQPFYLEATFEDHVIARRGDTHWKIPYAIDGKGAVSLGEESQVEQTYAPVSEAEGFLVGPLPLREGEADGSRWNVVVIQAGISKNRTRYSEQVLEAASDKYDGAQVFWDHSDTGAARSARDLAGFISDVSGSLLESARGAKVFALTGTLNVTSTQLREGLLESARLGNPGLYGLSHDAKARTSIVQVPGVGAVREVQEILDVLSVDVVSRPAAGGRVVRIAAGDGAVSATSEKEIAMFEKLLEQYKALRPAATIKEGITEDELIALIKEAMTTAPVPQADAAPAQAPAATVSALSEDDKSALREMHIDRAFAGVSLPDSVADGIREELRQQPDLTAARAKEVVAKWVARLAPLGDAGRGSGVGGTIAMGVSEAEKKLHALDGLFAGAPVEGQRFKSIREAYVAITGDADVTGLTRNCRALREMDYSRVREAISASTFGEILGDSIRRQMVREYQANPLYSDWRWLVDVTSASDFRTNRRTRMGGYGNLPAVAENGAYAALTSPGDEEATYAVSKRGGKETISWETIKNDDMGAIRRIPTKLAMAAARTLYEFIFDFLDDNPTIYDTVALFHATHANLGSAALDATTFTAARLAMAKQAEAGSSKRLGLVLRHIVVPAELEETAYNLFVRTTNNDKNFAQSLNPNVHVSPYWTDTNNWYATADKSQIPTIEVAFLDGREEPDLFWQDSQTEGTVFTNDQFTLKIRHVYGGNVLDYRGLYGAIVI